MEVFPAVSLSYILTPEVYAIEGYPSKRFQSKRHSETLKEMDAHIRTYEMWDNRLLPLRMFFGQIVIAITLAKRE